MRDCEISENLHLEPCPFNLCFLTFEPRQLEENKIRLRTKEIQAIRQVLFNADPQGRIFLFGSRVSDARKGGDIDVYFESSKKTGAQNKVDT